MPFAMPPPMPPSVMPNSRRTQTYGIETVPVSHPSSLTVVNGAPIHEIPPSLVEPNKYGKTAHDKEQRKLRKAAARARNSRASKLAKPELSLADMLRDTMHEDSSPTTASQAMPSYQLPMSLPPAPIPQPFSPYHQAHHPFSSHTSQDQGSTAPSTAPPVAHSSISTPLTAFPRHGQYRPYNPLAIKRSKPTGTDASPKQSTNPVPAAPLPVPGLPTGEVREPSPDPWFPRR